MCEIVSHAYMRECSEGWQAECTHHYHRPEANPHNHEEHCHKQITLKSFLYICIAN